jgi:hypothetical protein
MVMAKKISEMTLEQLQDYCDSVGINCQGCVFEEAKHRFTCLIAELVNSSVIMSAEIEDAGEILTTNGMPQAQIGNAKNMGELQKLIEECSTMTGDGTCFSCACRGKECIEMLIDVRFGRK